MADENVNQEYSDLVGKHWARHKDGSNLDDKGQWVSGDCSINIDGLSDKEVAKIQGAYKKATGLDFKIEKDKHSGETDLKASFPNKEAMDKYKNMQKVAGDKYFDKVNAANNSGKSGEINQEKGGDEGDELGLEIDETQKEGEEGKEAVEKEPDREKSKIQGGDMIDLLFGYFLEGVNNLTDTVIKYAIDKPFDMTIGALTQKLVKNLDKKGTKADLEAKAAKRKEKDAYINRGKFEKKYGYDGTTTYYEDVNKHKKDQLRKIKGGKNGEQTPEGKLKASAFHLAAAQLIDEKCKNPKSHRDYMQSPAALNKDAAKIFKDEMREVKYQQELAKINMKGMSADKREEVAYNLKSAALRGKLDNVKLDKNGEKILEDRANKLANKAFKANKAVDKRINKGKYAGKGKEPNLPTKKNQKEQSPAKRKNAAQSIRDAANNSDVKEAVEKSKPAVKKINQKGAANKNKQDALKMQRARLKQLQAGAPTKNNANTNSIRPKRKGGMGE